MATEEKPVKMNIQLSPPVAEALRKFAFESTGKMRGISEIAEKAIRQYLESQGVAIRDELLDNPEAVEDKARKSLNPCEAQAALA